MVEVIAKRPQKKRRRTGRKMFSRHKVCRFCADKELEIDYKDAKTLRIFLTERSKIIPRRISGNCARHQRKLTTEIKRSRHLALLPYTSAHT
ncbi:MAG TPA: 30S ribosomal protein S18 [Myxococcota bacterium]|jgi:small subunit ribosomal protein S18|nr:30S ribosomal protein S18 [Myxococcota bacterium]